MIEQELEVLERIYLFKDIDFKNLINLGLTYGFIVSLSVGLFVLAIYYSLKLFHKV